MKELSALDYVLLIMNYIPRFAIYAVLLQSASKIIRNNCAESKVDLFYLHYHSLYDLMEVRWSKLQKQKDSVFFVT